MPKYIAKFGENLYCEWSTIVDAPVTYLISLEDFKKYIEKKYGQDGIEQFPDRLKRVEETGTSCYDKTTLDYLIAGNRAGENESTLTKEQIIEAYTR